jgi:16S rRNA (cytosine967-C5)-methyltransferase
MTPAARVQAAIEILDAIIEAALARGAPADRLIADWFRNHRFAGSKDKRALRDLVYQAIRACGPVPASGRSAMLRLVQLNPPLGELFDGSQYGPARISEGEIPAEGGVAPHWLADRLSASGVSGKEAEALLGRAPLDIRVNALKANPDELELPATPERLPTSHGLRLPAGTQIEQWEAYQAGLVEVQDAGSQLACEVVGARAGETIVDLCAGAGGKTLALAAAMQNSGALVACDTDRRRLGQLAPRAERAGARIADTILMDPGRELDALHAWQGKADAVLVDAPCSGTGTWRRNPESRWRLTEQELDRLTQVQQHVLGVAERLVKPGGRLIYVTCSLLDEEGPRQIVRFAAQNADFKPVKRVLPLGVEHGNGWRLTPHRDGTDGFFFTSLHRS